MNVRGMIVACPSSDRSRPQVAREECHLSCQSSTEPRALDLLDGILDCGGTVQLDFGTAREAKSALWYRAFPPPGSRSSRLRTCARARVLGSKRFGPILRPPARRLAAPMGDRPPELARRGILSARHFRRTTAPREPPAMIVESSRSGQRSELAVSSLCGAMTWLVLSGRTDRRTASFHTVGISRTRTQLDSLGARQGFS